MALQYPPALPMEYPLSPYAGLVGPTNIGPSYYSTTALPSGAWVAGPGPAASPTLALGPAPSTYGFSSPVSATANTAGAYTLPERLSFLRSMAANTGPQIPATPTLGGMFPGSSIAGKASGVWNKFPGGAVGRGLVRGAVAGAVGQGIQTVGGAALGDTAADPDSNDLVRGAGQAFTRGFGGGVAAGGTFGVPGAIVGGLGAGLGNLGGYLATGGQGHLGNVPLVGGLFGGGSANQDPNADFAAKYGVDPGKLTAESLKSKLDGYNFTPEVRAQVRDAFNRDVADMRSRDMSNDEAMAKAYKAYFIGDDKTQPIALQYREGKIGAGADSAAQGEAMRNAMALTALMTKYAPQLAPDMSQFRAIQADALSNLTGEMRGFADAAGRDIEGRVLQSAADQGAIFRNLPLQIATAAMTADQAAAQKTALELEKARISAGASATPLPAE